MRNFPNKCESLWEEKSRVRGGETEDVGSELSNHIRSQGRYSDLGYRRQIES